MTSIYYTDSDCREILKNWKMTLLPSTGPIPGNYFNFYTKPRLSELKQLSFGGQSTATYILYEYYRENGASKDHLQWREKAADQGFEKAVIEIRKSRLHDGYEREDHSTASLAFMILLLFVGCVVAYFVFAKPHR